MILGGLWHGAAWTFVIWGALQGALLAASHVLRLRESTSPLRRAIDVVVTFHWVCLGWVFFRAANIDDALAVLGGWMRTGPLFVDAHTVVHGFAGVVVMLTIEHVRAHPVRSLVPAFAISAALFFGIALLGVEEGSQFIYFQF